MTRNWNRITIIIRHLQPTYVDCPSRVFCGRKIESVEVAAPSEWSDFNICRECIRLSGAHMGLYP